MRTCLMVSTVVAVCAWSVWGQAAERPVAAGAVRPPAPLTDDGQRIPRRDDRVATFTSDVDAVRFIDAQIRHGWSEAGLKPSPRATELEWCRRVYLDVIGRVPTVDELFRFQRAPAVSRRATLLNELLDSSTYADEYARYWTTVWSNILIGRPSTAAPDSLVNREGFRQYLHASFLANKPYDVLAYELISASGDTTPGELGFNGAVNYLVDRVQADAVPATVATSQHFLGTHIQCAQCHCHPFADHMQGRFWSINAFFRQAQVKTIRKANSAPHAVLSNGDFLGEGKDPRQAVIFFDTRRTWVYPAFPEYFNGEKINPSGLIAEVDRRSELARFVIQSDDFEQAIVNRLWARFLTVPLGDQIDELGHSFGTTKLAVRLSEEFSATGYDLKRLVRWIALSEPYALSSRVIATNVRDDLAWGNKPRYSRFYVRQMEPEQVYDSIQSASRPLAGRRASPRDNLRATMLVQFSRAFKDPESAVDTTYDGTVPQMLLLMNGEMTAAATSVKPDSFLFKLASSARSRQEVIEYLYLASLGRRPQSADWSAVEAVFAKGSDQLTAYQDIWWALLNSNEFILVH